MEVLAIILLADFITGLIHWWEDTYGVPEWWLIGMAVIAPNIEHHENPSTILHGTYWSRNFQPIVSTLPLAAVLVWFGWYVPAAGFMLAAVAGNEVHAWNHGLPMPRWAKALQDMGLLQSKRQHGMHHQRPWDKCYCTLTNVMNPVLDGVRFWRALEWVLPAKVQRGSEARRGF